MKMRLKALWRLLPMVAVALSWACSSEKEHTAPAVNDRDSVAVMTSYGVNTLISDSGIIKYRIVTEEWIVNQNLNPSRWIFNKGVLLVQFDQTLHIQAYIQADSALYFDKRRLWQLHGNVRIHTKQGTDFASQELYWDQNRHELWSHKFSTLRTPDRYLQGHYFLSDEQMTHYTVTNTLGSFTRGDVLSSPTDTMTTQEADSARHSGRQPEKPRPKTMAP